MVPPPARAGVPGKWFRKLGTLAGRSGTMSTPKRKEKMMEPAASRMKQAKLGSGTLTLIAPLCNVGASPNKQTEEATPSSCRECTGTVLTGVLQGCYVLLGCSCCLTLAAGVTDFGQGPEACQSLSPVA